VAGPAQIEKGRSEEVATTIGSGTLAFLSGSGVDSASMRHKATLPLLLLLLVAGQMSAEFCMAQCQNMRMSEPACAMHDMTHGRCASCKHASANSRNASLLTPRTCSGQTCNSVLGLLQNRSDLGVKPLISRVSIEIFAPPIYEGARASRFRDARNIKSILPFDPLISSLRI
jgi:hypothetical protein